VICGISRFLSISAVKNDLARRLAVALPIAAYYSFSVIYSGFYRLPLLIALFLFCAVALHDFYALATRTPKERPFHLIGAALALAVVLVFWNESLKSARDFKELQGTVTSVSLRIRLDSLVFIAILLAGVFLGLAGQLVRGAPEGAIYSVGATILGVLYTTLPICHSALILNLPDGLFYLALISWCTFMGDTAAYLAGRLWGKHNAGIFVSPNKTIEGYVGGALLSVALIMLFYFPLQAMFNIPYFQVWQLVAIALGIYVLTVLGDLLESLIKRDAQRKDSGSYFAGHGGLLDIIDSLLLVMPVSYYLLKLASD
jgi:phosphatidate cytidylyltransferase